MLFLFRRLSYGCLLLFCTSFISFGLLQLAPGDFFDSQRLNPQVSPATINELRQQTGSNQPIEVRYLHWLHSLAKGDWGYSLAFNQPAAAILWPRLKNTLLLTSAATLLAWALAILLGIWAAAKPRSFVDGSLSAVISALLATPELVLSLTLLFFAVRSGYLPAGGMISFSSTDPSPQGAHSWREAYEIARHLLLPVLCLAAGIFPAVAAHTRAAMKEVLQSSFITAAMGLGIPYRRILWRHALPVAANPLTSLFGLSFGALLSSSLVVEAVFAWPGLGQLMLNAIFQRDLFLIVDVTVLGTICFIVGNLLSDLLLYALDPRIRSRQSA